MNLTIPQWIEHVETSISRAARHDSGLHVSALGVKGFSTGEQRRIMNNLCHIPQMDSVVYVEAGCYFGGTACATMCNNSNLTAFLIEDFSQPFGAEGVQAGLIGNVDNHKGDARRVELINADFFKMDLSVINAPVDIFFFDAEHSESCQRNCWSRFVDKLNDVALLICDDWDWPVVHQNSRLGLQDIADKYRVIKEWILSDGVPDGPRFHNGLALFLVEKL